LLVIRRPWVHKDKRFTASIPVDEVRRIRSFVTHTSAAGAARVVIVDTAEDLNASAANALLKSLEEPPARTFFLLVTSEPGRLLPTLRSRCRLLTLQPLDEADLKRAAMKAMQESDKDPPAPSDWLRLTALSEGSVRRLLQLWTGGGLELQSRIEALLGGIGRLDWGVVHALGDELGSAAAAIRFEMFFDLLMQGLARSIRAAASGDGATAAGGSGAPLAIGERQLASWAELWETLVREKSEAMAYNLDRKSLILDTFRRIETAARG
jgi:DNA polymerase-3 subunit delta'